MNKLLSVAFIFMLLFSFSSLAFAQEPSDFEAALPLLDLVAAASQKSDNAPESVPDGEGRLSAAYVKAFLQAGLNQGKELGINEALLGDTKAQEQLLSSIFAAGLPELETCSPNQANTEYIGFFPRKVYVQDNGTIKLIGGLYTAPKALSELTVMEYADADWFETGIFTLSSDDRSPLGYRIEGYTIGSDLSSDETYSDYADNIAVEYVSNLGFSVLYPSDFSDDLLVEDESGVSAALPDGSAGFYAMRAPNTNGATLESYAAEIAAAHPESIVKCEEGNDFATVYYLDEEGSVVFTVFAITDEYIYQAELECSQDVLSHYSMYQSYLKNSFIVNELSLG